MLPFLLLLGIRFLHVAPEAGLDFRHHSGSPEKNYILVTIGGGVAWIDYDRDGWPNLYVANDSMANFLFRNRGDGRFLDVAVNNLDASAFLYRNEGAGDAGHWLNLALEGGPPNRSAIGTPVILHGGNWSQLQEVQGDPATRPQTTSGFISAWES